MTLASTILATPAGAADRRSVAAGHAGWLFALALVGYPIFGMLAVLVDVESTIFTVPGRIGVALYSLAVFVMALYDRPLTPFPRLVALFWLIYMFRLSWDTFVTDVYAASTSYIFFVSTTVIPGIPLALLAEKWDDGAVARKVAIIGAVSCGLGILAQSLGLAEARSTAMALTGRLSFDAVNPILFGHAGVVTAIAGLVWAKTAPTSRGRVWAILAAACGGVCLVLAASRGPLVSGAAVMLTYLAVKRRWGVFLVLGGVTAAVASVVQWQDVGAVARFVGLDRDASALDRIVLQQAAIADFLAHPVLGIAYLEPYYNNYPHNIVIESAMALGFFGLLLLLALLAKTFVQCVRLIRRDVLFISLVAIEAMTGAQFSGSIYASSPVWLTMAILLAMRLRSDPVRG
jgi:O-antigen ligase